MILDKENVLSDDQAVTASAASSNYMVLQSVAGKDSAVGNPGDLLVQVTEAFAGGTSIAASIQTDDDAAFGSAVTLNQSPAIATASLVAGYRFPIALPKEGLKKYLRVYYTVVGTMSAGKIFAGIVQVRE